MTRKEFAEDFGTQTLTLLEEAIARTPGMTRERSAQVVGVVSEYCKLSEKTAVLALLQSDGFAQFLQGRSGGSNRRFEDLVKLLFERLYALSPPELVADLAAFFVTDAQKLAERPFFVPPADFEGAAVLDSLVVPTVEQRPDALQALVDASLSSEFADLLRVFRIMKMRPMLRESILHAIATRTIMTGNSEEIAWLAGCIAHPAIMSLLLDLDDRKPAVQMVLDRLVTRSNRRAIFGVMAFLHKTFGQKPGELMQQSGVSWIWEADYNEDFVREYKTFFREYFPFDKKRDNWYWEYIQDIEKVPAEHVPRAILILNNPAFISARKRYQSHPKVAHTLAHNLLQMLKQEAIGNLRADLFPLLSKVMLGLKVDPQFLRRRADFFDLVASKNLLPVLEALILRFSVMEYLLIAIKKVPNKVPLVMPIAIDHDHKVYIDFLDAPTNSVTITPQQKDAEMERRYHYLLAHLLNRAWEPAEKRFAGERFLLAELREIGMSTGLMAPILEALEDLPADRLDDYHNIVTGAFRDNPNPASLRHALSGSFWYELPFHLAMPHFSPLVMPLAGMSDIVAGNGAFTDGKTITLPATIGMFRDPLDPLEASRNLTMYSFLALHEAAHIFAGSFAMSIAGLLRRHPYPKLFRRIDNIIEDFRVEQYLVAVHQHPVVAEVMEAMNVFLSVRNLLDANVSRPFNLLHWLTAQAAGYGDAIKSWPGTTEVLENLMSKDYPCGRWRNLAAFCEAMVTRLRNLPLGDVTSGHRLALEITSVVAFWPVADLEGFYEDEEQTSATSGGGMHVATEQELIEIARRLKDGSLVILSGTEVGEQLKQSVDQGVCVAIRTDRPGASDLERRLAEEIQQKLLEKASNQDAQDRSDELSGSRTRDISKEDGRALSDRTQTGSRRRNRTTSIRSLSAGTGSRTSLSTIEEKTVTAVNKRFLESLSRYRSIEAELNRQLAMILRERIPLPEASETEGDLDVEALISLLASRPSPQRMEWLETLSEVQEQVTFDIIIGLDISGSTGMEIGNNNRVIDVEKAFAILFGRALRLLTPQVQVIAFDTLRHTTVYHLNTIEAASSLEPGTSNRDGDFIRYCTSLLAQSRCDRRMLIQISDGMPCVDGTNYNGKHALDDTVAAMQECTKAGITLLYLNIDPGNSMGYQGYFEQLASAATWAEPFSHPRELLSALPRMLRMLAGRD